MELRLKELCRKRGITQKELSANLGVAELTLSRASKGNTSVQLIERIAEKLNVEVWELFTQSTEKQENIIICPNCGTRLEVKRKGE
ncbi:MAG: helix-turn-helix domain-containing protein [Candidatus Azobacteroides sp.]|nr:helix-turn-helix domain-containing protein [Candidatus Azobacteroides sp.]